MANTTRRNTLLAIGAAFAILAGAGLALSPDDQTLAYEHGPVSVAELTTGDALVVDIRRPEEWTETGVVEGSLLFTYTAPERFLGQLGPELADGRDLVLICRSGNRTQDAADELATLIPNRIISVEGGIRRIISEGYQTVTP